MAKVKKGELGGFGIVCMKRSGKIRWQLKARKSARKACNQEDIAKKVLHLVFVVLFATALKTMRRLKRIPYTFHR